MAIDTGILLLLVANVSNQIFSCDWHSVVFELIFLHSRHKLLRSLALDVLLEQHSLRGSCDVLQTTGSSLFNTYKGYLFTLNTLNGTKSTFLASSVIASTPGLLILESPGNSKKICSIPTARLCMLITSGRGPKKHPSWLLICFDISVESINERCSVCFGYKSYLSIICAVSGLRVVQSYFLWRHL